MARAGFRAEECVHCACKMFKEDNVDVTKLRWKLELRIQTKKKFIFLTLAGIAHMEYVCSMHVVKGKNLG